MANYIAVTTPGEKKPLVDEWLAKFHCPREEIVWVDHSNGFNTVIIASEVAESFAPAHKTWLRGCVVKESESVIAFGSESFVKAGIQTGKSLLSATGEFICLSWNAEQVLAQRDFFTSVSLSWTTANGVFAVSDSILILASLRIALGSTNSFDSEIAMARSPFSSISEQQMENRTLIKEIHYVPAAQGIRFSFSERTAQLFGEKIAQSDLVESSEYSDDYSTEIRKSALWVANVVKGLHEQTDIPLSLSLSGGYDSRVVLTGFSAAGILHESTIVSRGEGRGDPRDFDAVTKLVKDHGVPVQFSTAPPESASESSTSPLLVWASTLLGAYDRFSPSQVRPNDHKSKIALTGMGAEILKGNWNFRSWKQICSDTPIAPMYEKYFAEAGKRGIADLGAPLDQSDTSEWYYIGYRNGIHATGGHIANHMTAVTPLHQRRFVAMAHKSPTRLHGFPEKPELRIADLNILLDSKIAAADYDRPERNLNKQFVQERIEFLGGVIRSEEIDAVRVYGAPINSPGGSSTFSLNIAESFGLNIEPHGEAVMDFVNKNLSAISSDYSSKSVEKIHTAATKHLIEEKRNVFSNTSAAGKLVNFIALSRASSEIKRSFSFFRR